MSGRKNVYRHRVKTARREVNGKFFPGLTAIVLVVGACLALSYLGLDGRCNDLSDAIRKLEEKKRDLDRRVVNEQNKLVKQTSPENLLRILQSHRLVMALPSRTNVVHIKRATEGVYVRRVDTDSSYAQGEEEATHD